MSAGTHEYAGKFNLATVGRVAQFLQTAGGGPARVEALIGRLRPSLETRKHAGQATRSAQWIRVKTATRVDISLAKSLNLLVSRRGVPGLVPGFLSGVYGTSCCERESWPPINQRRW